MSFIKKISLNPLTLRQVVGVTGLILTKLDGSARGGCVVFSSFSFSLNGYLIVFGMIFHYW